MSKEEEWVLIHKYKISNLYLLKCGEYYKIGVSLNLPKRLKSLETGNPYPIKKVDASWCHNAEKWERRLHEALKGYRIRGEWFDLKPGHLRLIKKIMEYHGDEVELQNYAHTEASQGY